ncbi:DEAD/DEAH box helicase [Corallococcus macrosporus]|uniref:DEAD/DEAH box helicase domain-containing protein n=1 Tax=Myxococcus fulvus (strain ATCC BAA-855 / HW-1) TaxID=483219 RepID=F8CAA3_MYXFH|nr:DEAD/DEAH box helicase [Corallococcus macrosporus]AEI64560.1 DEAD/DEAH box helicase domain-containing protein [Corallococcus macrosporus]
MSARSMDVFSLRDAVVNEYKQFATSFTTIHADDIRSQIQAIYAQERYWPEPLIQLNPSYKRTTTVQALVDAGGLAPRCDEIFRTPQGAPLSLYKHQEQAVALAAQRESYVVTTGTGSGKSLCFFIPIVSAVLEEKRADDTRRTRAIIIYPMNALANSQLEEIHKYLSNVHGEPPITFARYTSQEDDEERRRIAANPPDILLTNFMMLELLLTRQETLDRQVMKNCEGLRFLVLDELHTYRGRQGADVALLVRRVREQLAPDQLQCIGTSATMAASTGTLEDKSREVARVASKLFSMHIPESNVIVETLERVTDPRQTADSVQPTLGQSLDAGIPHDISDAHLRTHPLAIWVETRLGVKWSPGDQRWVRAPPLTVTEAVAALHKDTGQSPGVCQRVLRELLLNASVPETERTGSPSASAHSFFAFKLHQFISGAGHAFATLDPPGQRTVTIEGQQFLPSAHDKRLYPVHFCRICGHEYHPGRLVNEEGGQLFRARDIDDAPPPRPDEDASEDEQESDTILGFLTLHPPDDDDDFKFDFKDRIEDYPDTWVDLEAATPRLKPNYRRVRARSLRVEPTGRVGTGSPAWFLPGRFRFCLRCGETHSTSSRDRNRLASLSAEGRSSATTVLVGSALRWMHGANSSLDTFTRKLLGFTDNRQDAALQAGHFNDFLFVSLIRAGFLGALDAAGAEGLRSDALGSAQQKALGFDRPAPHLRSEWLLEPALRGFHLQEAESTLRQVLSYRTWFDQRRGWRYTNPNLEQLGLVQVDYLGLDALCEDDSRFATAPSVLRDAPPAIRAKAYRELLDHMRKWMAIRSHVLEPTSIEQLLEKSHARLRTPWGFGVDEKPRGARWLMISPPSRHETNLGDEDLIVRGGSRSALGRTLRAPKLWAGHGTPTDLKPHAYDDLIQALLRIATDEGLISEEATPFENRTGWRLNADCVCFKRASPGDMPRRSGNNPFFRDFYVNLARMLRAPAHPLFGFEAREHTAQVDSERRELREKRFRYRDKEQEELSARDKQLREMGEANRFLPVLFCSPTMELGVDISALNAVYLRNVPPTPANYAQRSGRAGRSGQAALVLTYAAALSPHDQYFFRAPKEMVHGEVRPPLLDLANRELVDSHLQAVWLACTEEPLDASISDLLHLPSPERPLRPRVAAATRAPHVAARATERIKRVLAYLTDELTQEFAPWFPGVDEYAAAVVAAAPSRFEKAFDRWRDLFQSAEQQRDAARRTMDDYSAPQREKKAANERHRQAIDQLNLLQRGASTLSSDFYTFRYLATEGFLPGYNFPRLPLMAYVPATHDGRGRQTYLHRPRFLALAEFGPRSLIYHEGRAYRVVRAKLSIGHRDQRAPGTTLPTEAVYVCKQCGAGHFNTQVSVCHACRAPLGDADIIQSLYRIENVDTQPAERITANDEERQRQGFDLQTTFEWARREHVPDATEGTAHDEAGEVLRLTYGPGATITRLNKGLRRRAEKSSMGFHIDPVSGYWTKTEAEDTTALAPTSPQRQRIVPMVKDHKNALLLQTAEKDLPFKTMGTLQHALLRGIQSVFQLEEGEVLAEPMPTRESRKGVLFYEATEGGAGVLTRLVAEPERLAQVALAALRIMHFQSTDEARPPADLSDVPDTECVAACYRCLMSYYNQTDHELIDRRDPKVQELLLRIARARTTLHASPRGASQPTPPVVSANPALAPWLAQAMAHALPPPDATPFVDEDVSLPLIWRAHYVAAVFAGTRAASIQTLVSKGFEVLEFPVEEAQWSSAFEQLARALGRTS